MSFAKAAEELFVTPAALSYQIKSLEEHLGVQLFHRMNRAIALTHAGDVLRPGVADGFASLQGAVGAVERLLDTSTLTITAGPAFTAKWLAPRMFRFAEQHPEIELRFVASLKMLDFDRDRIDAAIRFGPTDYPECFQEILAEDWLTPFCTPEIAATIKKPEDILNYTLIHDDSLTVSPGLAVLPDPPNWATWLRKMGLEGDFTHGPRFSNADHAIDAAIEGGGIVLGRASLIERDLARGNLAAPFIEGVDTGGQFRFVCPKGRESDPRLAVFLEWIRVSTRPLAKMRSQAILL